LGWDSEKTAPDGSTGYYDLDIEPVTAEWFKTTYGGELVDNPEYQRAKQQLGLD
jgi:hypothetical protein